VTRDAYTNGAYLGDDGFVRNFVEGATSYPDALSVQSYMSCVSAVPGAVGCSFDPALLPPVTHWYQRPSLPTSAAAHAQADWGVARVRTFRGGAVGGEDGVPGAGSRSYYATAKAEWQEDLTYLAPTPGIVTFEVRLHGTWNDFGRLAAYGGVPHYEADAYDWLDGQLYDNCIFGQLSAGCAPTGYESSDYTFLAGNDELNKDGSVDRLIYFSALIRPSTDPRDPEDPTPVGPTAFLIGLSAASTYADAEVDAYSTMTLERVILQPGASISFGSGTQYLVTTVPEPAAWVLWLLGIAGMAGYGKARSRAATQA
jgi:hypothetical protein